MGLTLWQVYRQMEASMNDATEKMASLTYMPVRKRYLPWRVSSHGTVSKKSKNVQNVLKSKPISTLRAPKLKVTWNQSTWNFEKNFAFSKLINRILDSPLLLFNLESKYLEQKEQILRTSISTVQISWNLPGNPYPWLAMLCDWF